MEIEAVFTSLKWTYKKLSKCYQLNCPFAQWTHPKKKDGSPSCVVWPKRNFWKCYSCGQRGNMNELFEKYEFYSGIEVDVDFNPLYYLLNPEPETELFELSEEAISIFEYDPDYLIKSELWQTRKYDENTIPELGLLVDKRSRNLVFPVRMGGKIYGAVGRSLQGKRLYNYFGFPTGHTLGGMNNLTDRKKIAVVEGMTCLIRSLFWARELGFDVVCSWTANITKEQARLLLDTGKTIHCWYDQDSAGNNGWKRMEKECGLDFGLTRHVWDADTDVGGMSREQFFSNFKR